MKEFGEIVQQETLVISSFSHHNPSINGGVDGSAETASLPKIDKVAEVECGDVECKHWRAEYCYLLSSPMVVDSHLATLMGLVLWKLNM